MLLLNHQRVSNLLIISHLLSPACSFNSIDRDSMSTERFPLQSTYACAIARHIKTAIFQETDLTAIASVSINKFLAKMASGQNKPIVF
ncbi:MAG: hypothetical protein V7L00_20325 [Nostoc sp.]